jgi:hypothetical protein
MTIPPGFISEEAQAKRINKSIGTLRRWRAHSYGPKSFKIGKEIIYREDGYERWIEGIEAEQPPELPRPRASSPRGEHRYPRRGRPRKADRVSAG